MNVVNQCSEARDGGSRELSTPLGHNVTFCSLRHGVSIHDLCRPTLPLLYSFYREQIYTPKCRICTYNMLTHFYCDGRHSINVIKYV